MAEAPIVTIGARAVTSADHIHVLYQQRKDLLGLAPIGQPGPGGSSLWYPAGDQSLYPRGQPITLPLPGALKRLHLLRFRVHQVTTGPPWSNFIGPVRSAFTPAMSVPLARTLAIWTP